MQEPGIIVLGQFIIVKNTIIILVHLYVIRFVMLFSRCALTISHTTNFRGAMTRREPIIAFAIMQRNDGATRIRTWVKSYF